MCIPTYLITKSPLSSRNPLVDPRLFEFTKFIEHIPQIRTPQNRAGFSFVVKSLSPVVTHFRHGVFLRIVVVFFFFLVVPQPNLLLLLLPTTRRRGDRLPSNTWNKVLDNLYFPKKFFLFSFWNPFRQQKERQKSPIIPSPLVNLVPPP